jgi:hypothetical protein
MDVGVALIPGGNNGLMLATVPALSPGGTAASLLMTTTIVLRLSARATTSRKGPSNKTHTTTVVAVAHADGSVIRDSVADNAYPGVPDDHYG